MDLRQSTLTIGVDPGLSVGIAALLNYNKFYVVQFRLDRSPRERLDVELSALFVIAQERNYRLKVATERFVVNRRTARMSQQGHAQLVNGRVQTLSPVEVELQSVSDAHRFASNARLRQLGLWTTPTMVGQPDADDANSAMRHAVLLLARKSARQYARLVDLAS